MASSSKCLSYQEVSRKSLAEKSLNISEVEILIVNAQSFYAAKSDTLDIVGKCDIDFLCLNETWEDKQKPFSFKKLASSFHVQSTGQSWRGSHIY